MTRVWSMMTSMLFLLVEDTEISLQWQPAVLVGEPLSDSSRVTARGRIAANRTDHLSSCSCSPIASDIHCWRSHCCRKRRPPQKYSSCKMLWGRASRDADHPVCIRQDSFFLFRRCDFGVARFDVWSLDSRTPFVLKDLGERRDVITTRVCTLSRRGVVREASLPT